mgnify:FL=1
MAEKLDPNQEMVAWQDIVYSNMIQTEALARVMVEKGLMTKEEFTKHVEEVHKGYLKNHPEGKMPSND